MDTLEKIIELKDKKSLSDLEFEKELGLKPRIVAGWRQKKSKSYMDIISKLAEYFNVSADYLLGLSDTPTSPTTLKVVRDMQTGFEDLDKLPEDVQAKVREYYEMMRDKYLGSDKE